MTDLPEVLRWALTTRALGVPHLFDNNPQDSSFVRGHQLACAQILDVIENGWVNRRDPLDIYRDLGLTGVEDWSDPTPEQIAACAAYDPDPEQYGTANQ